jgi:hypothetical protein
VDSNVPDVVHSDTGSKKQQQQTGSVKISDVLGRKDGDEVWVVIKGDVYEYAA